MSCEDPPFEPCADWDDLGDADTRAWAQAYAGATLWRLTGRRFGLCEVTVRPCAAGCQMTTWARGMRGLYAASGWVGPVLQAGVWFNSCGCARADDCGCAMLDQIWLRPPVYDVTEVLLDGVTLDPATYRLDRTPVSKILTRIAGDPWPSCQDLALADDADGAFAVTYRRGEAWPAEAARLVGLYACELVKSATGADCEIPARATTIVREGVTIDLQSQDDLTVNGKTGVRAVDDWIGQLNPAALRQRPFVWSPDLPSHRRTS